MIRRVVPVGVALVLVSPSDRILLIQRQGKHGAGTWTVPGGWVDPGEDPLDAALRETREEVACTLPDGTPARFLGYTHTVHAEGIEDVCLWFGARAPRDYTETIAEPAKISAIGWYGLQELPPPLFGPFAAALDKGIVAQAIW